MIANDLKSFAFGSTTAASLALPAKVRTPRVAARLATLGMAEAALAIIVLFAFSKGKGSSTFGASNFKVWHGYLPSRLILGFAFDFRKVYSTSAWLYSKCSTKVPALEIHVPVGSGITVSLEERFARSELKNYLEQVGQTKP